MIVVYDLDEIYPLKGVSKVEIKPHSEADFYKQFS